jgi:hypothetical protein
VAGDAISHGGAALDIFWLFSRKRDYTATFARFFRSRE